MMSNSLPAIQVKNINKSFGINKAVNNVSFDVPQGKVIGFLGPNGSGKTTTNRIITSFYTPDSGNILVNGIDNQENDLETRKQIGYLPENNPIYGEFLVREYLFFIAKLRGLDSKTFKSNIDRTIQEAGLEAVYNRPINQCSKGYRQRVGLAQAILHKPPILILDEPTEGLDPNQRIVIRILIKSLGTERTVLISTHVLPEVEAMCDEIVLISKGNLVANGTVEELKNQSIEADIEIQIEGDSADNIQKSIIDLGNIKDVQLTNENNNIKTFSIKCETGIDLRDKLFTLAVNKKWILWDLHKNPGRLEDLFRRATLEYAEPVLTE